MKKFYSDIQALCGLTVAGTTSLSTATGVTVATSDNSTKLATTAFVKAQGYLTSYTETDTLATVTGRGATTSTAVTLNGGATISNLLLNGAVAYTEGSLALGAHGTNEGGQLVLQKGTSNTYAAHLDNYSDQFRVMYGTNTASSAVALAVSLSTRQLILPAYTSTSSFSGTAVGYLAFDSAGNVITVSSPAGAVTSIIAGTGVSVSSATGNVTISIGQSVATSAQVTFDSVITSNNGNGTNVRIGDDAWLGDINLSNTIRIQGVQNSANAYIVFGSGDATALGRAGTGALTYGGNTVYHSGNLTNLNQLTNGPGYITSYTETDTLATVTGRGASTNTSITVGPDLVIQADGSVNYTASRLKLNSHNNYRGAGMHLTGVDSNWFVGTPYTDFSGGFVIARKGAAASFEDTAQYSNALFTVKSSGNVGIGTTSPAYKLDVATGNDNAIRILNSLGSNNNGLALAVGSGTPWLDFNGASFTIKYNTSPGSWNSGANSHLTILSGGNVGIGTSSPSNKLQVANGDMSITSGYSFILADTDTNWRLGRNIIGPVESVYLNSNTFEFVAANASDQGWQFINDDGYPVLEIGAATGSRNVWVNAGNLLVPTGSVGIGTTSPTNKLQVGSVGSSGYGGNDIAIGNGTQVMAFYQSANASTWYTNINFSLLPSGVGSTGNLGIGTDTPSEKLHVVGRARITTIDNGTGDFATISGTGVITRRTAAQVLSDIGAQPSGSYLTAEADTLATVTARGATTTTAITVQGGWASTILDGDNVVLRKPNYSGGGWARTLLNFQEYDTTSLFQIGGYGSNNLMTYGYLGSAYNTPTIKWYANKNVYFSGSILIDDAADNNRYQKGSTFLNLRDPWNNLHMSTDSVGGNYIDANLHYWRPAGGASYWMTLNSTGLGIGTTAPNQRLSVEGGNIQLNANNAAANYYLFLNKKTGQDGGILFNRDNNNDWQLTNHSSLGDLVFYSYGTASEAITLKKGTGNVGIGTTSPDQKLHVKRTETVNRTSYTDILTIDADANNSPYSGHGGGILFRGTTYSGGGNNIQGNRIWGRIGMFLNDFYDGFNGESMFFAVAPDDRSDTLTTAMTIQYNGNVGIGTTSPIYKLQVAGSAYVNGGTLFIDSGQYLRWGNSNQGIVGVNDDHVAIVSGGATRQTVYADGRTYFPGLDLSISNVNSSHGTGTYFRGDGTHFVLGLNNGNTLYLNYGNPGGTIYSYGTNYHSGTTVINGTASYTTGGAATLSVVGNVISFGASNGDLSYFRRLGAGQFQWQTYNSGNTGEIHLQPYGGNVGVSTTAPNEKLHVAGRVRIDGGSTAAILETNNATASDAGTTYKTFTTADHYAVTVDYVIYDAGRTNMRTGTFRAVWSTGNVVYTDVSTVDLGATDNVTLTAVISGANVNLIVTGPTDYTLKYNLKVIK